MPTPVVMPQMGESIAEGTIVRWIKKVGDSVDRDEPLFEISTDKVDAEIPSPVAGVLTEIKVHEGETVAVNSVVATIGQAGEAAAVEPDSAALRPPPSHSASEQKAGVVAAAEATQPQGDGQPASSSRPLSNSAASPPSLEPATQKPGAARSGSVGSPSASAPKQGANGDRASRRPTAAERRHQKSSPLVRRIAQEHDVEITDIAGSGIGGRVTKDDILGYLENHSENTPHPSAAMPPAQLSPGTVEGLRQGEPAVIRPMSVMRKKIAEHMIVSRRTSAHVYSVFHVDFSTIHKLRQQKKAEYERMGAKLTYLSFVAKTVVDAIRRHPIINASIEGENVVYKTNVNLGIAVALDEGLIVPVIKNADERNLLGLSRAISDVAERARTKQLKPEEVQGGTFTITNPGQFGAQFGLPIINQPQVAILYVGTVEKRPVVIDDAIAIRTMAYLTIGFDHRLIDGAVADRFMADLKTSLEHFEPNQV